MTGDFAPLLTLTVRPPRLLLFAGKGGVGKTTCAAATALALAQTGRKVLAFSTDPAHSLADSLRQPLGDAPQAVYGVAGLHALELDASAALEEFRERWGGHVAALLAEATYLSEEEAADFVQVGVPGVDELTGLARIVDLLDAGDYEHLVWDSAPTGHTLRLLELPGLVDQWIQFLAGLQRKYINVMARFTGGSGAESDLLLHMKRVIRRFSAAVRSPATAGAVVVTAPEPMAVAEIERLVRRLTDTGIPVRALLANQVVPDSQGCAHCTARHQQQAAQIERIRHLFPTHALLTLAEQPGAVQGVAQLKELLGAREQNPAPAE